VVIVLGSSLMGSASACREILKKCAITCGKLVVLGVITALQAPLLTVRRIAIGRPKKLSCSMRLGANSTTR
jgi:hypothetical protein